MTRILFLTTLLPTLYEDKQYYHWILEKEFSAQVKQIVKDLVSDYEKKLKSQT